MECNQVSNEWQLSNTVVASVNAVVVVGQHSRVHYWVLNRGFVVSVGFASFGIVHKSQQ